MISLIISIIGIALIAALSISSIYFLGDTFKKNEMTLNLSMISDQSQQILGSFEMSLANDKEVSGFSDLIHLRYLKEVPKLKGNYWSIIDGNGDHKINKGDRIELLISSKKVMEELCSVFLNETHYVDVNGYKSNHKDFTVSNSVYNENNGCYVSELGNFIFYQF